MGIVDNIHQLFCIINSTTSNIYTTPKDRFSLSCFVLFGIVENSFFNIHRILQLPPLTRTGVLCYTMGVVREMAMNEPMVGK